jgi:hypothetical protein
MMLQGQSLHEILGEDSDVLTAAAAFGITSVTRLRSSGLGFMRWMAPVDLPCWRALAPGSIAGLAGDGNELGRLSSSPLLVTLPL